MDCNETLLALSSVEASELLLFCLAPSLQSYVPIDIYV